MEKLSGIIPPMVTPLTANHALDKDGVAKMGLIQNVLATPFTPLIGKELETVRAAIERLKKLL